MKSVKQEYERRICNMQNEMKKLQAAQKEHAKLMRERGQHERQLRTLKADLAEMKKTKVRVSEEKGLVGELGKELWRKRVGLEKQN